MTGKSTVLYSSTLVLLLLALSAWLNSYVASPETADFTELQKITMQINNLEQGSVGNSSVQSREDLLMGWWYPGEPACDASEEARETRFDVLKPEYFAVRSGGVLEFMTAQNYTCNGYSIENVDLVKSLSDQQYVMVSSSYAKDMEAFLDTDALSGVYVTQLVNFVVETGFTGVELDFEDYGGWTPEIYSKYKDFIIRLGNELQKNSKKLMVDLPPVSNSVEEQWYVFRLSEIEKLPIDYIVIMGYDYQYDHGVGEPVAPLDWLKEVVNFTKSRIQDKEKIVIGISSYGYIGDKSTNKISILTNDQAKQEALYVQATRDNRSKEFIAETRSSVLVYSDQISLDSKIETVRDLGIGKVSIWHLGGNVLPSADKQVTY